MVLGQELVEVAEGVVDALGGLEALGIPDERRVDVGGFSLLLGSEGSAGPRRRDGIGDPRKFQP